MNQEVFKRALTDRLWTVEDIAEIVKAAAPKPGRPETYKKRTIGISKALPRRRRSCSI